MRRFHKELHSNLVSVIKLLLSLSSNRCDIVDTQLKLILLKKVKQIFIYQTLRKQLQHFQVWMICITESSVLETRIVNCSYLVKQIKCNFGCSNRLFPRVYQVILTKNIGLVEVHYCNVVKATENIILNFVLHEWDSRVKRIMPCQVEIIDNWSKVFVPVQMLGQSKGIFCIHLYCRNVLIEEIHRRIAG